MAKKNKQIMETKEQQLDYLTQEILKLKKQTAENIVNIGYKLYMVKQVLEYGEFTNYLKNKVDFTRQQANKFMKIFEVYHNDEESKSTLQLDWGIEKLYTLTTISAENRDKFIEENDIDKISTRELKKKVKEFKNPIKEKEQKTESKIIDVEIIEPEENPIKERTENKEIEPKKILKKAEDIIKEIKIRTGEFYTQNCCVDDVKCDDRGGVLAQLYAIGEITEEELLKTVQYYKRELERHKKYEKDRKREQKYKEKKEKWESIYNYITSFKFEDIYDENCDIKDWKKYKENDEQYKKYQQRQKDRWKDYDFGNLFGDTQTTINKEDKPIYKKLYKTLALSYHPDKIGGDGREMQIINDLKQKWGV